MKMNKYKVEPFEEMLRILFLEKSESIPEDILDKFFQVKPELKIPDEKAEKMLTLLESDLQGSRTFGEILLQKLDEKKLQLSDIANRTGLTVEILDRIKNDTIFPNQIPVLLMKRLIEFLGMNFNEVKLALKQTVNYLLELTQEPKAEISTSLLYSRRFKNRKKDSFKLDQQFNSFDYSNAEKVLEIYLKRLEKKFEKE